MINWFTLLLALGCIISWLLVYNIIEETGWPRSIKILVMIIATVFIIFIAIAIILISCIREKSVK